MTATGSNPQRYGLLSNRFLIPFGINAFDLENKKKILGIVDLCLSLICFCGSLVETRWH